MLCQQASQEKGSTERRTENALGPDLQSGPTESWVSFFHFYFKQIVDTEAMAGGAVEIPCPHCPACPG